MGWGAGDWIPSNRLKVIQVSWNRCISLPNSSWTSSRQEWALRERGTGRLWGVVGGGGGEARRVGGGEGCGGGRSWETTGTRSPVGQRHRTVIQWHEFKQPHVQTDTATFISVFNHRVCIPVSLPSRATRLLSALRTLQIPCHPFRKRTSGRWKGSRSLGVLHPVNHYGYIRARWKGKHRVCEVRSKAIDQTSHHVTVTQILVIRMTPVNIPSGNLNRQNSNTSMPCNCSRTIGISVGIPRRKLGQTDIAHQQQNHHNDQLWILFNEN